MANVPPEHCPSCGTALRPADPPTVFRCESCGEHVFHNPVPNGRAVVLDDDAVLLVEIAPCGRVADPPYDHDSEWELPGGHVETGEQPSAAVARELAEETGLTVDPDDLVLFDAAVRQVVEGSHALVLLYAVERSAVRGRLEADDDASDARFWSPEALAASERARYRVLHDEPDRHRDIGVAVSEARTALDERRGRRE